MKKAEFEAKLKKAIDGLVVSDKALLGLEVNERTVSARLAHYLTHQFEEYDVDCEYNRFGTNIKRLPPCEHIGTDDIQGKTIYPDIIIHKRGTTTNLAIIEVKKVGNNDTERDVEKLKVMTNQNEPFKYNFGVHLTFSNGGEYSCVFYIGGEKVL